MEKPVKSFQFRADGSRAASGGPSHPWQYSLAALATLYEKYKAGDWLPGALVRMLVPHHEAPARGDLFAQSSHVTRRPCRKGV